MEELDVQRIREVLCRSLCAEIDVKLRSDRRLFISTPFTYEDGDVFTIIADPLPGGGVRISDCGNTLMHLSYTADVKAITEEGNRGELFRRIISEADVGYDDGEIYVETTYDNMASALFRLGQAITRVHDISFLSRARVA